MKKEASTTKFCDLLCEHAKWPNGLMDGAGTCRTFVAVFCTKKNMTVLKNASCNEKELRKFYGYSRHQ
jgi:hypothetical protein